MKLYYKSGACSLSSHIIMLELGLDPELIEVDLATKLTKDGEDFNKINSKGYVPALVLDNGEIITESPAVLQYLADLKPELGLAPAAGSFDRVRLQEWLNFISSELHKNFAILYVDGISAEFRNYAISNIKLRLDWANKQMEGKTYLVGEKFTVADSFLFNILGWCDWVNIDMSKWSNLTKFMATVATRPSVQTALKTEELI